MSSPKQDRDFIQEIVINNLPNSLLEEAQAWIGKNCDPGDVFDEKKLREWAEENGYVLPE